MSKFLKHLGIGTGGKKSSVPSDFQAKTLPPAPSGKGYGRRETIATAETCRECTSSSCRVSTGGGTSSTETTGNGRRASHDAYRTMPARGLRSRPDRDKEKDWSLRGPRSRETSSSLRAHNNCPLNESDQHLSATFGSRRKTEDSKELRRSITTDEIGSTATMPNPAKTSLPPALGEYSDPFDLKVQIPESPEVATDPAVALPLADDDYSVPYELKDRPKESVVTTEVTSKEEEEAEVEVETVDNSSKYDDPYEENPFALIRQQNVDNPATQLPLVSDINIVESRLVPERPVSLNTKSLVSETCIQVSLPTPCSAITMSDAAVLTEIVVSPEEYNVVTQTQPVEDTPRPMRSYELSAEYGGFFVPSTPVVPNISSAVQDTDKDDDMACTDYLDLQPQESLVPSSSHTGKGRGSFVESANPGLRHTSVGVGASGGFYEEPWDLSTTRRGLTDKWKQTKQTKDVGVMAVLDSVMDKPAELYAQPHKGADRSHRKVLNDSSEMRSTGPSYGILCQRVAENGMMAPVGLRDVGIGGRPNGAQRVDTRPVDDYDVPWDQKKVFCKTANDVGYFSAKLQQSSAPPTHVRSFSLVADRDVKLPLDKQAWYHGSISRRDAENVLRGHQEGSYLIRTSESNKLDYSLSVKSVSGFMHMKIVANQDGRYILGQFSQPFQSIAQMVHYYTMNKLPIKGAEHISLSFPVKHELL